MHQTTPGSVDLKFRPRSYFWADELGLTLSSSIKGAERKAGYERSLAIGEEFPSLLAEPTLSRDVREVVGRIHPRFMGGEYLPDRMQKEVVIARIAIASTTMDVTCTQDTSDSRRTRQINHHSEGRHTNKPRGPSA